MAFGDNRLTSVSIPNSVKTIGKDAFDGNPLTSITIGANVKLYNNSYGRPFGRGFDEAYENGGSLAGTYIRPNTNSTTWTIGKLIATSDFEAITFPNDKNLMITKYIGSKKEVVIPSQIQGIPVTSIGDAVLDHKGDIYGSFSNKSLIKVTIPNSVTSIGRFAFNDNQLTSITIGANVDIGENAFADRDYTSNRVISSGFEDAYNNGGELAGTYTRPDTKSTTWTRQ
jgi:hypothetical protein